MIAAWTSDLTHEKLIKTYIRSERLQKQAPKIISMNEIRGVFIICAFMYLISGVVFILEILTVKFAIIRVPLDFCTFKRNKNAGNSLNA